VALPDPKDKKFTQHKRYSWRTSAVRGHARHRRRELPERREVRVDPVRNGHIVRTGQRVIGFQAGSVVCSNRRPQSAHSITSGAVSGSVSSSQQSTLYRFK
jgi:hypothetical protein